MRHHYTCCNFGAFRAHKDDPKVGCPRYNLWSLAPNDFCQQNATIFEIAKQIDRFGE